MKEKWHLKEDKAAQSFLALQKKRSKTKNQKKLEHLGPMERLQHLRRNVPILSEELTFKPKAPFKSTLKVGLWAHANESAIRLQPIQPAISSLVRDFELRPASSSSEVTHPVLLPPLVPLKKR